MTRIRLIVAGVALLHSMFWLFRLSAFRKDRAWERTKVMFAMPYETTWDILNPSNYLPEGRMFYGCYVASLILAAVAMLLVVFWWP